MTGDLFVSVSPGEIRAVLFERDRPVDLFIERTSRPSRVNAIYRGRIARVLPALPGMMIDLGDGPGFLPGTHLPDGTSPVEGAAVIVELIKDGFDDKPPELSARWSVKGRSFSLSLGPSGVVFSKKLPHDSRERIGAWLETALEPGEAVVVRTRAGNAETNPHPGPLPQAGEGEGNSPSPALRERVPSESAAGEGIPPLAVELDQLRAEIRRIVSARTIGRLDRPKPAIARILGLVRDEPDRIVIDDAAAFAEARGYLPSAPLMLDAAPHFDERHGIDAAFEAALAPTVALDGGGHLTLERTTGYLAVDVDLGSRAGERAPPADAIRAINLAAAQALAQELRRRSIGGAVVVDFVSMDRGAREAVAKALESCVADDPAGVQILGWTRLGHLELTRRRVRPSLGDLVCGSPGAEERRSFETIALAALRRLARTPAGPGSLRLITHPSVRSHIEGPLVAEFREAVLRAGRAVKLESDPARDVAAIDLIPA